MNTAHVVAAGVVTALGDLDSTWEGLMAGRSGLGTSSLSTPLARYPVGEVKGLAAAYGNSARLEALLDRLLHDVPSLPTYTPLVVSSTKAGVDELLGQAIGPWPGQPWDLADIIGKRLGLTGAKVMLSAACASGTLAIINAAQRLVLSEAECVLVVGIDLLSCFVLSGFARLQALALENCRPFDKNRNGLSLGEGAGYLLLATPEAAARNSWPLIAQVKAWGAACDAGHITAPCREASGLLTTLTAGTKQKQFQVGAVNAHGTGTKFNDAMELTAFSAFWEKPPAFHSIKGAIGHCLGAAGVIEAAVALKSLESGVIPPTVGLEHPEDDSLSVSGQAPLPLRYPSILSTNSGFGGINACVLFNHSV